MLGPPHGGSPACNRAVTDTGRFDVKVPPGRYYAYVTRGPFATLDRALVELTAGEEVRLSLLSTMLPMLPPGVVSGDFHVHGAGSYDSSIPDRDRVLSFLAAGVDVIVATDHDVVSTYADTLVNLTATNLLTVIPGVEQTPNILWFAVPGETFPKTLGHFNFWPLAGGNGRRISAPWDELREPGQMMDEIEPLFSPAGSGVRQLNHPYSESKLGRDQGFLRAIGYDPTTPVHGDSFAAQVLNRSPGGGHRNIDWDVQEVMTGASRAEWLRYRALWFSLLSQGSPHAGAANSDTHSLSLEQVGYPRNLIFGGHDPSTDVAAFNADVRAGHMVGTNGPVLDVTIVDKDAQGKEVTYRPNVIPALAFKPSPAARLNVTVTGAPWIPIEEMRVIINGDIRRRSQMVVMNALKEIDHFGAAPWRITFDPIPLADVLPRDLKTGELRPYAWLIVEAGMVQNEEPDRDHDGLPDLQPDNKPHPELDDLHAIAPDVWPVAFTNPFLIDNVGDGWQAPGL
jgi:hypothetical protein